MGTPVPIRSSHGNLSPRCFRSRDLGTRLKPVSQPTTGETAIGKTFAERERRRIAPSCQGRPISARSAREMTGDNIATSPW